MKYLVIGAGGTGGPIGGFMSKAGLDVTLIARGQHKDEMNANGLSFEHPDGKFTTPVKACTMEEYNENPDVIFVCVKGYSLDGIIPFIEKVAKKDTVIIPILNIYGTGGKMQDKLPENVVLDGCIYVAAQIDGPGKILMLGKIFRVVYGFRKDADKALVDEYMPKLKEIEADLAKSDITPVLSSNIEVDALQKFSFVSPMAASGAYFDESAIAFQTPGPEYEMFKACVGEVKALSNAMNVALPDNILEINTDILHGLAASSTASMHRDYKAGKECEMDGLIAEVIRLGKKYGVPTPTYEKALAKLTENK